MSVSEFDLLTQSLFDLSDTPLFVLDAHGRVLAANRAARKLTERECVGIDLLSELGLSPQALEGSSADAATLLSGAYTWHQPDGRCLTVDCRIRFNPYPGRWRWLLQLETEVQPAGEFCDIESYFRAIIDTITDCVIVIDEFGIIQMINPAVEKLFGYSRQELLGRNISLLMMSPDQERHDSYLRRYCSTGLAHIMGTGREVNAVRKDGTRVPVYLSIGELSEQGPNRFVGILHDLSPRRKAEERLALLSSAVEQAPAGILIADLKGEIEYVNEGFTRLTGYLAHEAIGSNLFASGSVMPSIADDAALCWRLLSVRTWQGQIREHRKYGEAYNALVTFSPIQDQQGVAIRLLGRFQDITQQKLDQEALAESEKRFSEIARMAGEWLWEQDALGYYTYCSDAVEDILGYRPEEVVGKHFLELMTPSDQNLWAASMPHVEQVTRPFHRFINHYLHRNGHEVFTESTGAPILDEGGHTLRWRGVDMDITERKRGEDAVRLRERAIEAASVGIAIADARLPDFPNTYVNAALCRITGYAEEELLGKSLRLLQGKGTDDAARETIRSALRSGSHCEVIIRNYRKDGTGFWNELLLSPVTDETGELTHYIGIIADVSERRRAEDERHELEIARQIQTSLLPKDPLQLPGIAVAGLCVPAAQVGGDYFDFIHDGDYVDIVIADVSGHSVGAALIMAEMRSTLKAELRRTQLDRDGTAQLLAALNEVLFADLNGADLFISMFYLRYNHRTRHLRYASAGHNPPLLLRAAASSCEALDAEGLILGVKPKVDFQEQDMTLEPGDVLLLYTDGITESQNRARDFFGESRLCEALIDQREQPPDKVLEQILMRVREFRGTGLFRDDLSLVAIRIS